MNRVRYISPLITFSTINNISISVKRSNFTLVFSKAACHGNPGGEKNFAWSSFYILGHVFLKFSNTLPYKLSYSLLGGFFLLFRAWPYKWPRYLHISPLVLYFIPWTLPLGPLIPLKQLNANLNNSFLSVELKDLEILK